MEPLPKLLLPPGIPLVRTFRTDGRPIPTFLQDLLVDWACRVPSDHLVRLNDILKHVQWTLTLNSFDQGKIWYTVSKILKKDLLSDEFIYRDGRDVRSILLGDVEYKTNPYSPIRTKKYQARRKQELNIMSPCAVNLKS